VDVLDAIRSDRAVAVIRGERVADPVRLAAPPELVATGDHEEIGRRAHAFVAALS
jgi:hypothetical protein